MRSASLAAPLSPTDGWSCVAVSLVEARSACVDGTAAVADGSAEATLLDDSFGDSLDASADASLVTLLGALLGAEVESEGEGTEVSGDDASGEDGALGTGGDAGWQPATSEAATSSGAGDRAS